MIKMFSLTVKLLLFTCIAFSQTNSITGIIIDADDGQSITGCNVFISNTTKGKVTDTSGRFTLYDIPQGKSYELVVSSAGYETFTYAFSSTQLPLNLRISFNKKIVAMQNVTILPVEIDGWKKWGSLFLKSFLGTSENALECEIENTKIIQFRKNKKENILEASADGFLIVKNYRLGFIIKYQLEQFVYDFKNKTLTYQGYPLFEEMEKEFPVPLKFGRRRLKAYNGSLIHFFRSLYSNNLKAEGFEARRMVRTITYDTIMNDIRHSNLVLYDSAGKEMNLPAHYIKKVEKD
ncbi:MAG: carboxypeptidase-like regulatory domain-containing protein, partial [Ferruginibacter sp.]|nr:carboxypeptidase-like regulatory domain-containing protein [Ferruginibacter sp.]